MADVVGARRLLLRGDNLRLFYAQDPEVLLAGPAGTGKSVACLSKIHFLADRVPGLRALIARKTRESVTESALVTFEERVVAPEHPILAAGGSRRMRQAYHYPNGATVVVGGLDKPSKIMSTEYDVIYIQEATEVGENEWEALTTRLRNGALPYQQLMADCNPEAPTHWLKRRCDSGSCRMLLSRHEDNPSLFTPDGRRTAVGRGYLAKLDALTGARYWRLRHGRWVQAEGVVYPEWNPSVHLVPFDSPPLDWPRYWSIDFGFTNPFCWLCAARDPDGRLYVYRQMYHTRRLVEDHARQILRTVRAEAEHYARASRVPVEAVLERLRPHAVVCDHDAEGRSTLERHLNLGTRPAIKNIKAGIEAVKSRLRPAEDGLPRLTVCRDCLLERDVELADAKRPCRLEEEIDSYVWRPAEDGKDEPVDDNNHALDALRYLVAHFDLPQGQVEVATTVDVPPRTGLDPADSPRLRFGDQTRPSRLFGR